MTHSGELYYLVGKPNVLKHQLLEQISIATKDNQSVIVVKTVTTNEQFMHTAGFSVIGESDFALRQSMGLYSLNWVKKGHSYGVGGEIQQLLNRGNTVLLNGSLQNIDQAVKLFPLMNVVMTKYEPLGNESYEGYPLTENDGARLDWISEANGVYGPFVLTVFDETGHQSAADLLLQFALFDHAKLDKAV